MLPSNPPAVVMQPAPTLYCLSVAVGAPKRDGAMTLNNPLRRSIDDGGRRQIISGLRRFARTTASGTFAYLDKMPSARSLSIAHREFSCRAVPRVMLPLTGKRQGEGKHCAAANCAHCRYCSIMSLDDRAADRQTNPHAVLFAGVEGLEEVGANRVGQPVAGVGNAYPNHAVDARGRDL